MTTPSTENVRSQYQAGRFVGQSYDESTAEFDRWLSAYAQGVRNSVVRPTMTAREHLEAAREAAYEVREGQVIPANTGYLSWRNGECVGVYSKGVSYEAPGREGDLERRTLEPLPPLIPDDCNLVWAGNGHRFVFHRDPSNPDRWNGYDVAGHTINVHVDCLIDPKPVPKEGDR